MAAGYCALRSLGGGTSSGGLLSCLSVEPVTYPLHFEFERLSSALDSPPSLDNRHLLPASTHSFLPLSRLPYHHRALTILPFSAPSYLINLILRDLPLFVEQPSKLPSFALCTVYTATTNIHAVEHVSRASLLVFGHAESMR